MAGLELKNISKCFRKKQALDNVSCAFNYGITALLGPNGAGKSTLMNIMCTLLRQDSGEVCYDGHNVLKIKEAYLEKLSVQFQNQPMYKTDTAMEYLAFCGALKGVSPEKTREQGQALLQRFGIADAGKKKIGAFSGGMRQRLALSGTFLGDPKIVLLDEPSAGLDIYEREELKRFLCDLKKDHIIVVSTHIVSDIEHIADHIILLNEGRIHASGTQAALTDSMDGKVWELPADGECAGQVYHADGKRLTISESCPCPGAKQKPADLTDVYFGCVKAR